MIIRRLLATTLVGAVGVLAACGDKKADDAAAGPATPISFVVASLAFNFSQEMSAGFKYGVEGTPVVAEVTGPEIVNPSKQLTQFEAAKQASPRGLALMTLHSEVFASSVSDATAAGIPVIEVDNPPAPGTDVTTFVGNDNHSLGAMLADEVIKNLPPNTTTGKVIIGTPQPGAPVLDNRAKGMRDRFAEKLPKIQVMGPYVTGSEVESNKRSWQKLVAANPDALAFMATGDADGYNLVAIRKQLHAKWLAASFDLDPKSMLGVKEGDLLLCSAEHFLKGAVTSKLLAQNITDHIALPKGWVVTPGLIVNQQNIDEIMKRQAATDRGQWMNEQINEVVKQANSGNVKPIKEVT